ncbi:hypothetical protein ACIRSJ_12440 [Streptomyces virginiae]|uniref:hypothetical protein n=1 Tax=Streptomyces virginiae TaxID=1961 RepID=UPI00380DFC92
MTVLIQPNPERRRSDEDEAWHEGPLYELAGVTEPDLTEQQHADAGLRPEPPGSGAALYEQDRLHHATHLSDRDRAWFRSLIGGGHIWWDTGQQNLTNGQHRMCALRAAGVEVIPGYGRHLPDRDEATPSQDAQAHARRTVEDFWFARTSPPSSSRASSAPTCPGCSPAAPACAPTYRSRGRCCCRRIPRAAGPRETWRSFTRGA